MPSLRAAAVNPLPSTTATKTAICRYGCIVLVTVTDNDELLDCSTTPRDSECRHKEVTMTTTTRSTPRDLHQALADAFNRRSLDEILALYAEGATLAPQPGQSVTCRKEIAQALQGFLA